MSEKQEKKVVGRTVAIALGIMCIVLVVGLVGAVVDFSSLTRRKDSQIATLQDQVKILNETVNLAQSTVWVNSMNLTQTANRYNFWNFSASFAGYASVNVKSSTNNTYVRATYSAYGVEYNNQTNVGTEGTVNFPILPALSIEITVGNSNPFGATETVTVTYYY